MNFLKEFFLQLDPRIFQKFFQVYFKTFFQEVAPETLPKVSPGTLPKFIRKIFPNFLWKLSRKFLKKLFRKYLQKITRNFIQAVFSSSREFSKDPFGNSFKMFFGNSTKNSLKNSSGSFPGICFESSPGNSCTISFGNSIGSSQKNSPGNFFRGIYRKFLMKISSGNSYRFFFPGAPLDFFSKVATEAFTEELSEFPPAFFCEVILEIPLSFEILLENPVEILLVFLQ